MPVHRLGLPSLWLGCPGAQLTHHSGSSAEKYQASSFKNHIQLKPFLRLHRFIVLNLSFYRCKLPNLSCFPSIVLSFYHFIVLSFYRYKESTEFFYRFVVVKVWFYRYILWLYRCRCKLRNGFNYVCIVCQP